MKLDLYKNSWQIYKSLFWKLFGFTIALAMVFISIYVAAFFTLGYDLGLICILICAFVFVPLLYSYQIIIAKASSGHGVEYSDLYSYYKGYFISNSRGAYSIIINTFISFIVGIVFIYLGTCVYELTHKEIFINAINSIRAPSGIGEYENYYSELINTIINLPDYIYFFIASVAFSFLFYMRRIKKSFLIPYFNLIGIVPLVFTKKINKAILSENAKEIRDDSFIGNLVFSLAFIIGFIGGGSLIAIFSNESMTLEVLIVSSLIIGICLSMVFFPPIIINYCFIADGLQGKFIKKLKTQLLVMSRSMENDPSIDDEKKAQLKQMLDSFKEEMKDHNSKNDQ